MIDDITGPSSPLDEEEEEEKGRIMMSGIIDVEMILVEMEYRDTLCIVYHLYRM